MPYKNPEDRRRHSAEYRKANLVTILAKSKLRRERTKNQRRTKKLRAIYGITDDMFNALWTAQRGLCAICGTTLAFPPVRRGTTNAACIDHDHTTGKVRGLLCMLCNRGLGNFKDSAEALTRAAEYIVRYQPVEDSGKKAVWPTREIAGEKNPYAEGTDDWGAFRQGEQHAVSDVQDGEE